MHRLQICRLLVPVYFSRPEHTFETKPGSFRWKTEEKITKKRNSAKCPTCHNGNGCNAVNFGLIKKFSYRRWFIWPGLHGSAIKIGGLRKSVSAILLEGSPIGSRMINLGHVCDLGSLLLCYAFYDAFQHCMAVAQSHDGIRTCLMAELYSLSNSALE